MIPAWASSFPFFSLSTAIEVPELCSVSSHTLFLFRSLAAGRTCNFKLAQHNAPHKTTNIPEGIGVL